jgi:ribosomal protein S17E
MNKKKNPELKEGDRIILVYMPDESLDAGTKGVVTKIEKTPSFGGSSDYQYAVDWFDENNKVISKLSLLPGVDSWLFDPEYTQKDLNESKSRPITDLDTLINRHEWARLFRKSDLKYIMDYLEVIRRLGVVNMFQSGQFLGQTKEYLTKYFDLYRMQRELDDNKEELIEKILDMSEKVRNIMISGAITDLERKNKTITGSSATNRVNKLASEVVKHFMTQ